MKITVNGKQQVIDAPQLTIAGYLKLREINPMSIVIEHNYKVIDRNIWDNVKIAGNDNLEILKFIGGG